MFVLHIVSLYLNMILGWQHRLYHYYIPFLYTSFPTNVITYVFYVRNRNTGYSKEVKEVPNPANMYTSKIYHFDVLCLSPRVHLFLSSHSSSSYTYNKITCSLQTKMTNEALITCFKDLIQSILVTKVKKLFARICFF